MLFLPIILLPLLAPASTELLTVFQTAEISKFIPKTGAEVLNSSLLGQEQVTLCARLLTYQFTTHLYSWPAHNVLVFSPELYIYTGWSNIGFPVAGVVTSGKINAFPIWDPGVWTHVCLMLDSASEILKLTLNGETIVIETEYGFSHEKITKNLNLLGFPHNPGYTGSMFGRITDVHLWSRVLTEGEAQDWTGCRWFGEGGHLVDWRTAQVRVEGLRQVQLEREEVCREREAQRFLLTKRKFSDAVHLSDILGGEMEVTKISNLTEVLEDFGSDLIKSSCHFADYIGNHAWVDGPAFWTEFTDVEEETVFVNIYSGERLTLDMWFPGEPNNKMEKSDDDGEDCIAIRPKGTLHDTPCTLEYCSLIMLPSSSRYQLRGVF